MAGSLVRKYSPQVPRYMSLVEANVVEINKRKISFPRKRPMRAKPTGRSIAVATMWLSATRVDENHLDKHDWDKNHFDNRYISWIEMNLLDINLIEII
jgi:hypothetical protein